MSDHHVMNIQPSEWSWNETKNWLHFYIFLGIIPISIIVFCANVFIGPATLEPIPEGYIPKQWEYVRVSLFSKLVRTHIIYKSEFN